MKKFFTFLVICVATYSPVSAQIDKVTDSLKSQAYQMGKAFLEMDYPRFITYNHPNLLKAIGGEIKMLEVLKSSIDQMANAGMTFDSIAFGEPSKIIRSGTELQATIAQHLIMKTPKGRLKATATLVAFSADDGKTWQFADASGHDLETVRKIFPNLSPDIVVQRRQPPVYIGD